LIYDAIERRHGASIPQDLTWTLRKGGDAFVGLRYSHEEQHAGTTFFLGDFHVMVRQTILRRHPQLALLAHEAPTDITPANVAPS
jgi:hypothetical protein